MAANQAQVGEMLAQARDEMDGTRAKLLLAGLAEFAEKGFAQATTRDIAERAGVFQPQIAYFFSGKEQLWREAMSFALSRSDMLIEEILASRHDSAASRRAHLIRVYLTFAARNPEWASLVLQEGFPQGGRSEWLVETWLRPRTNKLLRLLIGRPLDTLAGGEVPYAMSLLAILTGAILIFSQGGHVARLAHVDAGSAAFLEEHIRLTTAAIEAAVAALPAGFERRGA